MANSFSQLYIQLVFGVKNRASYIDDRVKNRLEKYICGTITKRGCQALAIYCNPDHIHIFISLKPAIAIADLVRSIKANSSAWLHREFEHLRYFSWQDGYGAFSYSQSQTDAVVSYILNQKAHHQKRNFKEEYIDLLRKFNVPFDEQFLLDFEI